MKPLIDAFLATFGVALGFIAFVFAGGLVGRVMDWWEKR